MSVASHFSLELALWNVPPGTTVFGEDPLSLRDYIHMPQIFKSPLAFGGL